MHALYMDDAYTKEFEAEVVSVTGNYIVLSDTAFYPTGGGQPHDTGKLIRGADEFSVVFARKVDGAVSHEVDREGLQVGDKVRGVLDWERRYKLMRSHTASHIITAAMHTLFPDAKITGNQITEEKIRIDYNLPTFDRAILEKAIDKTNSILSEHHTVTVSYMPREEALNDPSLVKLAGAMPPSVNELRIVTIGTADRQADGGTHVHNTSEVGSVRLLKVDNKGKSNRRIYVEVND